MTNQLLQSTTWNDSKGRPIHAHGGGILFYERKWYWYGEYKKGDTYQVSQIFDGSVYNMQRIDFKGISCYSSSDLFHWDFEGIVLSPEPDPSHPLSPQKVVERPKVLYNRKNRNFVMVLHVDDAIYRLATIGIAVSDSPTGPFRWIRNFHPNGCDSRDMTVFADGDDAILFYSSEMNRTMHITRLTEDYQDCNEEYTTAFDGQSREAPAVFQKDGRYYMISSGCTGWAPNSALLAVAPAPEGPWTPLGNPCRGEYAEFTYYCQSTFVNPIQIGDNTTYLAMFDRWNADNLSASGYTWLPFHFDEDLPYLEWTDVYSGIL